ncbi:MAG: DUF1631 domain-containing protein [Pseudomonadales bacterium]|nr:DUF1631 domain-containing protein [Pseudomonadales bacterium]MCP5170778.1 DUF1631 domain-containing protein [Pseudomonadales bacterium]MCP5301981.1 DUF1631 domain-containing protein [Pseudomonadales bacterium]
MAESHLKLIDSASQSSNAHKLPLPLQQLRGQSRQFFSEKLASCFERVDDTFFDLADRAENNTEQATYFDAMRLIRLGRKGIEQRFLNAIEYAFNSLADENYQGHVERADVDDADELEVLDNEALEETIATEAMVSKLSGRCKDVLKSLVARFDFMASATVTAHNNPLGPEVICHALRDSLSELELPVRSKLVFFKLIDRYLIEEMNDWLNVANDRLREIGVLPDLEKRQRARDMARKANRLRATSARLNAASHSPLSKPNAAVHTGNEVSEASQLIDQLQEVIHQSGGDTAPGNMGGSRPTMAMDDLVALVSSLQESRAEDADSDQSMLGLIQSRLQAQGQGLRSRDHKVVQVLDQMFDQIRQQQSLAGGGFNRQLQKLEMPILRIALRDGSFFDQQEHPARQLLNEIADVAIGYSDEKDIQSDALGKGVASVIEQLGKSESVDNSALTELLLDFIALVEKERRRVLMMEQRIVDEVAASEKVNYAHRQVKALLSNRMKGRRLPRVLVAFAQEAWCRVLFMAHLKYGRDSNQWKTAVRVIDHLLYLTLNEGIPASKSKPVIETARQRLQDIAYDPYKLGRLIGGLEQLLYKSGKVVEDKQTIDTKATVAESRTESEAKPSAADSPADAGSTAPHLELVQVDKLSADLPGDSTDTESQAEKMDDDYLSLADALGRGAWVDFVDQQSTSHRCKVAGIISPPGKYIFVNRQGAKIAEISRYEIAKNIKDKKLTVLDNGQVFDRALQNVIQGIRHQRQTA